MGGSSAGASGSSDAPTTRRHSVTKVNKSTTEKIVDFVKGGGTIGYVAGKISEANKTSKLNNQLIGTSDYQGGRRSRTNNINGGDSGNDTAPTQVATNVGGTIVTAPSSAEVSQSKATDVTYDSRKTKARGRSMTIRTNSRGIGNNMSSVLGKKSLLGAA